MVSGKGFSIFITSSKCTILKNCDLPDNQGLIYEEKWSFLEGERVAGGEERLRPLILNM